eukprot:822025-Karenia_brevis.AAC.1
MSLQNDGWHNKIHLSWTRNLHGYVLRVTNDVVHADKFIGPLEHNDWQLDRSGCYLHSPTMDKVCQASGQGSPTYEIDE